MGAVVVMIVWWLDLQLPVQSAPITTPLFFLSFKLRILNTPLVSSTFFCINKNIQWDNAKSEYISPEWDSNSQLMDLILAYEFSGYFVIFIVH
jgi:hypothetical protein